MLKRIKDRAWCVAHLRPDSHYLVWPNSWEKCSPGLKRGTLGRFGQLFVPKLFPWVAKFLKNCSVKEFLVFIKAKKLSFFSQIFWQNCWSSAVWATFMNKKIFRKKLPKITQKLPNLVAHPSAPSVDFLSSDDPFWSVQTERSNKISALVT